MLLTIILVFVFAAQLTAGSPDDSKTAQAWDAKNIAWQKIDADGTKWSVLEGRSDLPGKAFTYAAYIPAGYRDRHSHSSDARVAVVQGTLRISFGDSGSFKAYAVGTFLFVPAHLEHTMAADEDTIIVGTATGPWETEHHKHLHH